jgi:hypothetical protein
VLAASRPAVNGLTLKRLTAGVRKGRAAARVTATLAGNGAATTWEIQRRVRRTSNGGIYERIASGTVSASRPLATITTRYTAKPGERLVCRVVARNTAGSITSATRSLVLRAPRA